MSAPYLTFSLPSSSPLPPDEDNSESSLKIKIHQATTTDQDQGNNETNTGFVMWPSAVMLSHYLTKNPGIVIGNNDSSDGQETLQGDILELGSGCGLAGLTAAILLQNEEGNDDKVIFTDYNPSVLENLKRNVLLNDFDVDHKVLGLDWFDQQDANNDGGDNVNEPEVPGWLDMNGKSHAQTRLIIGADLLVCTNDADLVASTIDNALMEGGQAVILNADKYARFGVSNFPEACRSLGLNVAVDENILDDASEGDESEQQLMDELELGGYNQRAATLGHDFTMFTIDKPIKSA